MLLADDPVPAGAGFWYLLAVVITVLGAVATAFVQTRPGRDTAPPSPRAQKAAANVVSQEILKWIEKQVIAPLRVQLDEVQRQLEARDTELVKEREQNLALRGRLAELQRQLQEAQAHVQTLRRALGSGEEGGSG